MFYLAQSYFDSQQWEKAEEAYIKRANAGGWEEEVYYSMFRLAVISCILERPFTEQTSRFLNAWAYRPIRAEPLYQLAKLHRMKNEPRQAFLYAKHAAELPIPPQDILFISEDVYKWMCVDEIGATAFYCNDFERGAAACKYIIDNKLCPDGDVKRIQDNLNTYMKVLIWHPNDMRPKKKKRSKRRKKKNYEHHAKRLEQKQQKIKKDIKPERKNRIHIMYTILYKGDCFGIRKLRHKRRTGFKLHTICSVSNRNWCFCQFNGI
jgi:hypothetical protein